LAAGLFLMSIVIGLPPFSAVAATAAARGLPCDGLLAQGLVVGLEAASPPPASTAASSAAAASEPAQ
jgi:hypothetical protein